MFYYKHSRYDVQYYINILYVIYCCEYNVLLNNTSTTLAFSKRKETYAEFSVCCYQYPRRVLFFPTRFWYVCFNIFLFTHSGKLLLSQLRSGKVKLYFHRSHTTTSVTKTFVFQQLLYVFALFEARPKTFFWRLSLFNQWWSKFGGEGNDARSVYDVYHLGSTQKKLCTSWVNGRNIVSQMFTGMLMIYPARHTLTITLTDHSAQLCAVLYVCVWVVYSDCLWG